MSEDPTRELPEESSFEARMLAEFAGVRSDFGAVRGELGALRGELGTLRGELVAIHVEQAAIRSDIAVLNTRLTTLEEKVDSRLAETRPIWEAVQYAIKRLEMKFDTVLADLYDVRTNSRLFDKRLMELEAR